MPKNRRNREKRQTNFRAIRGYENKETIIVGVSESRNTKRSQNTKLN